MENSPPQFVADTLSACAVSKDGHQVTLEFDGGGSLLWVTVSSALLPKIQTMLRELEALANEARIGIAGPRHLTAPRD